MACTCTFFCSEKSCLKTGCKVGWCGLVVWPYFLTTFTVLVQRLMPFFQVGCKWQKNSWRFLSRHPSFLRGPDFFLKAKIMCQVTTFNETNGSIARMTDFTWKRRKVSNILFCRQCLVILSRKFRQITTSFLQNQNKSLNRLHSYYCTEFTVLTLILR